MKKLLTNFINIFSPKVNIDELNNGDHFLYDDDLCLLIKNSSNEDDVISYINLSTDYSLCTLKKESDVFVKKYNIDADIKGLWANIRNTKGLTLQYERLGLSLGEGISIQGRNPTTGTSVISFQIAVTGGTHKLTHLYSRKSKFIVDLEDKNSLKDLLYRLHEEDSTKFWEQYSQVKVSFKKSALEFDLHE